MKALLKLEELLMLAASIFVFAGLHFKWWLFPALLFTPDISMIGYSFGNKTGAIFYNFFHFKAVAVAVYFAGLFLQNDIAQLIGVILFAHSSLDRLLGYGLKTYQGFKYTHLGIIGK